MGCAMKKQGSPETEPWMHPSLLHALLQLHLPYRGSRHPSFAPDIKTGGEDVE